MPVGPVSGGGGVYQPGMTPEQQKAYKAAKTLAYDLDQMPPDMTAVQQQLNILDNLAHAKPSCLDGAQLKLVGQLDQQMRAYNNAAAQNPPNYAGEQQAMTNMLALANKLEDTF